MAFCERIVFLYVLLLTINVFVTSQKRGTESNVILWQMLPNTNGIRYECSRPIENTSVFMECVTDGTSTGGDTGMTRAKCKCTVGHGDLYITCYKDGKWYPPILGACMEQEKVTSEPATQAKDPSNSGASFYPVFLVPFISILLRNL